MDPARIMAGVSPMGIRYRTRITRGGQITLSSEARRKLGLGAGDEVEVVEDGDSVSVRRPRFTLESAAGSIPALKKKLTDKEMSEIAWEEVAQEVVRKMRREK
jgi:AbrB family looped-hinge helix DNA binding protein